MKAGLVIVGVWSVILLLLALTITGAFGDVYAGSFYSFTLPFIIMAATLAVLALAGLLLRPVRGVIFWLAIPLHGFLFVPFLCAIVRWPGGDDGPGMAWLLFVGGGSCIAAISSLVLTVREIIVSVRTTEKAEK